jgi:tetratricopeptide (TPR) repeat protein
MPPSPDPNAPLAHAAHLLQQRRPLEARALIERFLAERPRVAEAHRLLGVCLHQTNNAQGAEAAFRAGLKLERGHEALAVDLADLLHATGRAADSERVLRTALEANRRSTPLAIRLAQALTTSGRAAESLALLSKHASGAKPDHAVLTALAAAQKSLGQTDRALATHQRAVALYPDSPVAHHNLAALHGDLGQFALAERSAARALNKGGTAPQTWLVYARAFLGAGKLDDAARAFHEALQRDPFYVEAHRDLAQLVWMRTEDVGAAIAVLDQALAARPFAPLLAVRANILDHAGQAAAAYTTLQRALQLDPNATTLLLQAAQLAASLGEPGAAVSLAERACALAPDDFIAQTGLCAACLAAGDAARAEALAAALVARAPLDQRALAYQATAWRVLGDPRYAALYDYDAFVRPYRLDVPEGWATLDTYLEDLAAALEETHAFRTHPLDQSLRHGSQTPNLRASEHPAIRAFFQAVDGPIRRHLAALGQGADPLRARNKGAYAYAGAWSVRLRPSGFHVDHVHPEGWLSSACYIALPEGEGEGERREAWIKFGQPGVPTQPALEAEHFVKPEAGMLVLFPSYMWHGTVPFSAGGRRLSVAFDLVPG